MRSVHVMSFIFAGAVALACAAETEETAHPPAAPAVGGEAGSYETGGSAGSSWEPSVGGAAGTANGGGSGGKPHHKDGGSDGGEEPPSGGGSGGTGSSAGTGSTGGSGGIGGINTGGFAGKIDGGVITLGNIDMKITAAATDLAPAPLLGSISSTDFWVEYDNGKSDAQTVIIKSAEITFTLGVQSLTIPMFSSPNSIITKGNFAKTVQHVGTTILNQSLTDAYCSGDAEIKVVFERENGTTQTRTYGPYDVDC